MSDKEMYIRIWGMVLAAIVGVVVLIIGYNIFNTIHSDQTAILKAQIDSSVNAKEAAQARYMEAKALSDKAMFEEMEERAKHPK